jgi:5'-methylthioadenosine phosphorylase
MRVGFVSGTSIVRSSLFDDWTQVPVETRYGSVSVKTKGDHYLINRHGFNAPVPPHLINHRSNLQSMKDLGVEAIVSLQSVGSLKRDLPPGTVVSCDDYVSFAPATLSDDRVTAIAPNVPNNLIPRIADAFSGGILTGKIYIQTRGPRFETKAEVRILESWGDVVGMTMAHEADLANELDIPYNSLCMIDNYAHGIDDEVLSEEAFHRLVASNMGKVEGLFRCILELMT